MMIVSMSSDGTQGATDAITRQVDLVNGLERELVVRKARVSLAGLEPSDLYCELAWQNARK